ncbi:MAG TPA: hypothetical protein VD994_11805 [Prosthecobacter sp.]|nr:hypothetical protein [Prosthecobacter sp.]
MTDHPAPLDRPHIDALKEEIERRVFKELYREMPPHHAYDMITAILEVGFERGISYCTREAFEVILAKVALRSLYAYIINDRYQVSD